MQLLAVAIYKGDRRRVVQFRPGRLNVITGWPGTGKSSVLEIVEYCLGRNEPTFARGALDIVEWYGLLVEHEGARVFIGRPAPREGQATGSSAMLQLAAEDLADATDLAVNADTDTVREALTRVIGIDENLASVSSLGREPLRATIAQALLLCFQRQGEISKPDQLFHRANEDYIPQAIKDTLPYFLGAVDSDDVSRRFRLQAARRELRRHQRELDELTQAQSDSEARAAVLIREATAAGLTPPDSADGVVDDVLGLRRIVEDPGAASAGSSALLRERLRLRRERRELGEEVRRVEERRLAIRDLRQGGGAFRDEVGEQRARLMSLGLLPDVDDGSTCPVCGQALGQLDATTDSLRQQISDLDARLADERALEPQRRRIAAGLSEQARELREAISRIDDAEAAITSDTGPDPFSEQGERQAFVRGRITQFLETLRASDPGRTVVLQRRIAELATEITGIEDAIDPATVAREVEARLHYVNEYITVWSQQLGLEHSEDGVRFDLGNLTLVANNRGGPIPLHRIGSAANQVGYHIVAHLALHRWFVEEERPVPRFLFLDQPEQAYYPEDVSTSTRDSTDRLSDHDQERVRNLYSFINDVTNSMDGYFQTIVVSHWNPAGLDWFQEARIGNWRDGEALVPAEWRASE